MGMFSSLFGKSGSDKADQMRQKAIDAFNAIQTPELKDLQVQLNKYVLAGQLSPEAAESELLKSNAFNDIVTDPNLEGAQKKALSSMQNVADSGGLTAIDKAQLNDIQIGQNQANRSQNEATMQQAQQRGMGGSDINTVNQLMNEQGNADRASNAGLTVAAQAQARALQAMQAAGKQAGDIRTQDYGEAEKKAQSANAIDLFNKQTLNATDLYNVDAANKAQAANLAAKQAINDSNTNTTNQNAIYNSQQVQQRFNDQAQKAQGVAGTYNNWANDANTAAATDKAADVGFTTGLMKAGATGAAAAFGGPAGAMAANSAMGGSGMENSGGSGVAGSTNANYGPNGYAPKRGQTAFGYAEGGEVTPDHPDHPAHMAMGGHVHCYAHGGEAHHHPECYMAQGGDVPDNATQDEVNQSFMQGMTDKPKPALPIEWSPEASKWELRDKTGNHIGSFASYSDATDFADKVASKDAPPVPKMAEGGDFRAGGPVPGVPKVPHNSLKNDTVPARLSPGEVVIPLDAQKSDADFENFMNQFKPSKKTPKIDKSIPLDKQALSNLHKRMGK